MACQSRRDAPCFAVGTPPKDPEPSGFRRNDLVVSRLFFFPSPHIPGKVPAGPHLPANVGAPSPFPPGRFSQPDFTNRRVSIHRCPGTVYETWTWSFEKASIFDLAVAVGAPFCSCPRPGAPYIRRPPPVRRANQSSRPPVVAHAVDSHLAVACVSSDGASGGQPPRKRRGRKELPASGCGIGRQRGRGHGGQAPRRCWRPRHPQGGPYGQRVATRPSHLAGMRAGGIFFQPFIPNPPTFYLLPDFDLPPWPGV